MNKQEISVITDEIAEAINHGRFLEAARKHCELNPEDRSMDDIRSKVAIYDFNRFSNTVKEIMEA